MNIPSLEDADALALGDTIPLVRIEGVDGRGRFVSEGVVAPGAVGQIARDGDGGDVFRGGHWKIGSGVGLGGWRRSARSSRERPHGASGPVSEIAVNGQALSKESVGVNQVWKRHRVSVSSKDNSRTAEKTNLEKCEAPPTPR